MKNDVSDFAPANEERWLKVYCSARAGFSVIWVVSAFSLAQHSLTLEAILLVVYPAWDAAANFADAARSGGTAKNRTQSINVIVSASTVLAVVFALQASMNRVVGVFGAWAILSSLLQLGTAVRRWKNFGAQWVMILGGGQSVLAGGFFISPAYMPASPSISSVAGYAAVGAAYFLMSAVWLPRFHLLKARLRVHFP